MTFTFLIELVNHLCESLNNSYRDIADIEILTEELNNKKKRVIRRIQQDKQYVNMILENKVFRDNATKECIDSVKDTLNDVDNLIESMKLPKDCTFDEN